MRIKLITALTTVALFALPVADAFAGHYSRGRAMGRLTCCCRSAQTSRGNPGGGHPKLDEETDMTTSLKLKLFGLWTMIALCALPVAAASAHMGWG